MFLILCLNGANLYAVNPVTGRHELALLSEEKEIALGRDTNREMLKRYKFYPDYELQKYVSTIGERLAQNSHRSDLAYTFTVLDSDEVNAFALPGGYIYITRGLMAYLNSEAELAAVLGHEIGHVAARHSVRQYSTNMVTKIGTTAAALLIPGVDRTTFQITQILGAAISKGYGREHELEADKLGAEYLARTNYPAEAMLDVIRTLKSHEEFETQRAKASGHKPRARHGLFATHPDNDTRLQEIVSYAARNPQTAATYTNIAPYLNHIDGLIFRDPLSGERAFRLAIIATNEQSDFQALARQSPLADNQEAMLRLLNGLYPKGEVQSKPYLKILK